jgi:hypothetical protein
LLFCTCLSGACNQNVNAQSADLAQRALVDCAKNYNIPASQYNAFKASDIGSACISAYQVVYKDASQKTFDSVCAGKTGREQGGCLVGRNLGKTAREADQKQNGGNGGSGTTLTDTQIKDIAESDDACQVGSSELRSACVSGFVAGYKNQSESLCTNKQFSTQQQTKCKDGYSAGKESKANGVTQAQPTDPKASADAKDACKQYDSGGSNPVKYYFDTCVDGYLAQKAGKNQQQACEDGFADGSDSQKACLVGFKAASDGGSNGDDTSACIANSSTTLEWLGCPLIAALSKGTEAINGFVENQLNDGNIPGNRFRCI